MIRAYFPSITLRMANPFLLPVREKGKNTFSCKTHDSHWLIHPQININFTGNQEAI